MCPLSGGKNVCSMVSPISEESAVDKDGNDRNTGCENLTDHRRTRVKSLLPWKFSSILPKRKQLEDEIGAIGKKIPRLFSTTSPIRSLCWILKAWRFWTATKVYKRLWLRSEGLIRQFFFDLFMKEEREHYALKLKTASMLNQVKHSTRPVKRYLSISGFPLLNIPGASSSGNDQRYYQTPGSRTAIDPGQQNGHAG